MDIHFHLYVIFVFYILFIYTYKTNVIYLYYERKVINNLNLQGKVIVDANSSSLFSNNNSNSSNINNSNNTINTPEKNNKRFEEISFSYNRCTYERIPKVSGQLETAQYLRYTNSSIIRFADGEIKLILGQGIGGKENASEELGKRMYEIFKDNDDRIAIGVPNVFSYYPYYRKIFYNTWFIKFEYITEWLMNNINYNKQYFDAFITSPYVTTYKTSCELVDKVYENLRAIWEDKDIVWLRGDNGEEYDYDVFDNVRNKKIYYGRANNSWSEYNKYKELLLSEDPSKLFIITLGHLSRLLTYDLTKEGRRSLDLGHLPKDYDYYRKGKRPVNFYVV